MVFGSFLLGLFVQESPAGTFLERRMCYAGLGDSALRITPWKMNWLLGASMTRHVC
jgi:hypothetical protein